MGKIKSHLIRTSENVLLKNVLSFKITWLKLHKGQ